jgi:uncharacterized protein (DUF2235 family)
MPTNTPKNIILCADGTGNKGGYTPDSNVYKTYNGVDIHNDVIDQITYYDNGVGTSKNKIVKALSGALGLGFKRNVRDLYEYLSMHYEEGDQVYLFGFSRGAATVRALLGFVSSCGLVRGKGLTTEKLKQYTKEAFSAYENINKKPDQAKCFREHPNSYGVIDIHFVGVWDTVSALGLPDNMDEMGVLSRALGMVFSIIDHGLNFVWSHRFYKYQLTDNIKHACQALALDDARTSFWPKVWDEHGRDASTVEQVWFAGMHSNVGGGYERAGLSNVTLEWMLVRAREHGLVLKPGFFEEQHEDANVNGRLYDSRDGMAIFYRYHPREIANLCANKLNDKIKIHNTVFERLRYRTADYVTTHLPTNLQISYTDTSVKSESISFENNEDWIIQNRDVKKYVALRKINYMIMLCFVAVLIGFFSCSKQELVELSATDGLLTQFLKMIFDFMPSIFEGFIERALIHSPVFTISFVLSAVGFWLFNLKVKSNIRCHAVKLRDIILSKYNRR